jgi:hypothetical protein
MQTPRPQARQGRAPTVIPHAAQLMARDSCERTRGNVNGPARSIPGPDPTLDPAMWLRTRSSSKRLATGMIPHFLGAARAVPAERSRNSSAPARWDLISLFTLPERLRLRGGARPRTSGGMPYSSEGAWPNPVTSMHRGRGRRGSRETDRPRRTAIAARFAIAQARGRRSAVQEPENERDHPERSSRGGGAAAPRRDTTGRSRVPPLARWRPTPRSRPIPALAPRRKNTARSGFGPGPNGGITALKSRA